MERRLLGLPTWLFHRHSKKTFVLTRTATVRELNMEKMCGALFTKLVDSTEYTSTPDMKASKSARIIPQATILYGTNQLQEQTSGGEIVLSIIRRGYM
jgi:hypothetical protein